MSGPVLVAVEHGAVMARIYERTGGPVPPPYAALFPSVESLFASIETAGQQGTPVEVRYDPILGYPVRVALGRPLPDRPMTSVTVLETR
jgi:hypothetical protein